MIGAPLTIVVSGCPRSGKTWIAMEIARHLRYRGIEVEIVDHNTRNMYRDTGSTVMQNRKISIATENAD